MIWQWISLGVLAAVLILAAVSDLRRGKVYNWITYPAVLAGLVLAVAQGMATGDVRDVMAARVAGLGVGFGVLFMAYLLGGMGGGDVKLMAAVGALVGWPGILHALVYSFLVAAAIGLIRMVWRGQTRVVLRRLWLALRILPLPGAGLAAAVPTETFRVPFGFAVCIGTFWYLVENKLGESLWAAAGRWLT